MNLFYLLYIFIFFYQNVEIQWALMSLPLFNNAFIEHVLKNPFLKFWNSGK